MHRRRKLIGFSSILVSIRYPAARFWTHHPRWVSAIHQRSSASASTLDTAMGKAQFLSRAGYGLTLSRRRNVLAYLHQQHTRSSVPIDKGGLYSSFWSLPRSLVLWSTRPNSDDGEPHEWAAVGDSGVSTTFPMHDAPVVQHLEASTLGFTRKTALDHVLLRASPSL
ncbi:uncharacterized protein LOC142768305 isoform X2 [Rhipicephalus microplus]|uniref:uncharacterized protein LOC142768292 isoform X2 n=1 Tax=Rhipicephalus microplus TaxID=6941 RepID=UPI003F6B42E7